MKTGLVTVQKNVYVLELTGASCYSIGDIVIVFQSTTARAERERKHGLKLDWELKNIII